MRQRWDWACAALGAVILTVACHGAAGAQGCDENNPASPAGTANIRLGSADFTDEARDEMRSFVVTGSLGPVSVAIVSATPPGIVRSFSATPQISSYSPHFGERLKGVDIHVALKHGARGAAVSVSLRQVCAEYFRESFLY